MASEAWRGLIRIAANYARLLCMLVLGLVLVRLLLRSLGNEAYGLIALLGSTAGVSGMLQRVVRQSMIRELGDAYHGGDEHRFRSVYNAALVLTFGLALLTVVITGGLLVLLPLFQIPDRLLPAAQWYVAARGVEFFFLVALAPPINMYLVSERMVAFNVWLVVIRASYVAAAVLLVLFGGVETIAGCIVLYGALSAGFTVISLLAAAFYITSADPRLRPSPKTITRDAFRPLVHIGSLNAAVLMAMNLHLPLGAVIMNIAFGLFGNLAFGLGVTLTSYVRMIATGMTTGLDAVSGRLSISSGDDAVRSLVHHATRLHAVVTFPATLFVFVLAGPLLELWVGGRVEDPAATLPPTVTLIRILSIGVAVRSISDGWISILYGAGHIRRYALTIIVAGVVATLLALLLIFTLPEGQSFYAVACAYSAVLFFAHGCVLPLITARALGVSVTALLSPLLPPLFVTLACAPIPVLATWQLERWALLHLGGVFVLFATLYLALSGLFVMNASERRRFARAALRRIAPGRVERR